MADCVDLDAKISWNTLGFSLSVYLRLGWSCGRWFCRVVSLIDLVAASSMHSPHQHSFLVTLTSGKLARIPLPDYALYRKNVLPLFAS